MAAEDDSFDGDSSLGPGPGPGDDTAADATGLTVREGLSALGPRTITARLDQRKLARGEQVGRYLVLDVVGEGGMGVVYAAYDPELDRKVAVKLLQARPAGAGSRGDQAWLLHEAKAMARLSHPNVLAVHDVGTLGGDRVFVAMELVDGMTLRSWLRTVVRSWREVLPVMRAAGAGLAAAHAAGLVHRDFKPDNVLVGRDGRARVMDFGLARLRAEAGEPRARDSDPAIPPAAAPAVPTVPTVDDSRRSSLAEQSHEHGTIAGTPAYMAPELYRGSPADPRSDQFAFGVAVYEALYRARPYDKAALADPTRTPVPRATPASDVPAGVARAVMRAIAVDPAARFATVDELLAELVDKPRRSRLAIGLVAAAAAAVAIAGALAIEVATRAPDAAAPPVDPCGGVAGRLAGVWDDGVRAATRDAFAATRSPLATASLASAVRELDRYAAGWTDAATDSCRATRVRGEQSEDAMGLRSACLDQRRDELRAFTALLAKADAGVVEKAGHAAASLEPVSRCADVAALRAPGAPPADVQAKLPAVLGELAIAKAQLIAGKTVAALATATAMVDHAVAVGWAPVIAEAQWIRGRVLQGLNRADQAQAAFAEASWAGLRGRRDDIVAQAALSAAHNAAEGLGNDGEARIWLALGDAVATRFGDRTFDVRRLDVAGIVAASRGDYAAARDLHERALAAASALANPALIAGTEYALAATLSKAGEFAKAAPHLEHVAGLFEAQLGADHPDVAVVLSALGACYDHIGDPRARETLVRSIAIREAAYGVTSPQLIVPLNNLADLMKRRHELADATATIERAITLAAVVPTSHPLYHTVATTRGEILTAEGKLADARAALDAVIALEEPVKSPLLATTLASRAEVSLAERAWAEAAAFAAKSIAVTEASNGKDAAELWRPLAALARAKAGAGDAAGARAAAQRAVAIGRAAQVTDAELGAAVALAR